MPRARLSQDDSAPAAPVERPQSLEAVLRKALQGAVYPLSADHLCWVARENAAPAGFLTLLSGLPRGAFGSVEAVEFALETKPDSEA